MKKNIICGILILVAATNLAQDNNYWNQMPGSKSALMGGVVVAGVRDNSAVFYNPGAMGFIDSNSVSISGATYGIEQATIINGGGVGINYTSSTPGMFPLVSLSGVIAHKKDSKHTFGYMLFTKNCSSTNFSYRNDGYKDTSILSGDGYYSQNSKLEYIGDYQLQTSLNEMWLGFTYAYKFNSHISIGFSPFIAYRTQSYYSSFISRVFPDNFSSFQQYASYGQVSSLGYTDFESITFTNLRALGKLGIALDYGNLKMGGTFTTRSINLGGSANIARDITYTGGAAYKDSATATTWNAYTYGLNFNDRQHVKTTYTSPYSASLGIDYHLGHTTFAFSGEYFAAVAPYNLATPADNSFLRPIWANKSQPISGQINSDQYLRITEASKSVTNFGFAVEQQIKRNFSMVASFRTDFTSYKKASNDIWEYMFMDTTHKAGQKINISNINLYHLTLGAIFKFKHADMNIGLSYAYGTKTGYEPFNNMAVVKDINSSSNGNFFGAVPNYTQGNYPYSYINNAVYKYEAFSILLGYTYHISSIGAKTTHYNRDIKQTIHPY